MRKTLIFLLLCSFVYGQELTGKKFNLGFSYSLTNEETLFNNPFSLYGDYQLKQWNNLDLKVGLRAFYYSTKESNFFSNKWGFNPNVSSSYTFKNTKLNSYFALGYYYDSFETEATIISTVINPKRNITGNGMTLTPGLKYFVHSNVFIDANVTFLFTKVKDDYYKTETGTNTLFNLGVGVAF